MDIVIMLEEGTKKEDGKALESFVNYVLSRSAWSDYIINVELNY